MDTASDASGCAGLLGNRDMRLALSTGQPGRARIGRRFGRLDVGWEQWQYPVFVREESTCICSLWG